MRLAYFCFFIGAVSALTGMGLGIRMGIIQDFQLAPVHAHINLLGWVTMSLFGLYHRGVQRPCNRLAWAQVSLAAVGFPAMTGGLAYYLSTGEHGAEPLIIGGSLLTITAMALFLVVVLLDFRAASARSAMARGSDPSDAIQRGVLAAWERS